MPAPSKRAPAPGPALLRSLRVFQTAVVGSSLLIILIGWILARPQTATNATMVNVFSSLGAIVSLGVISLQLYVVGRLVERLREEGEQPELLARLRKIHFLNAMLMELVVLSGVAMHVYGAPFSLAGIFCGVGLALELVFWPRGWAPAKAARKGRR